LSVDPLTKSYPWYTPYQFAGNKPIAAIDLDGLEELYVYYKLPDECSKPVLEKIEVSSFFEDPHLTGNPSDYVNKIIQYKGQHYQFSSNNTSNKPVGGIYPLSQFENFIQDPDGNWESVEEFQDNFNNEAVSASLVAVAMYRLHGKHKSGFYSKGFRTKPKDLQEKLTLDEAKGGAGEPIMKGRLKNKKYHPEKGTHDKMGHNHDHGDGTSTEIHYDRNRKTGKLSNFKIKDDTNKNSRGNKKSVDNKRSGG
jgi:hypothetical protein